MTRSIRVATARKVLHHEAEAIRATARRLGVGFQKAADLLLRCRGKVVATGLGKAGIVARKIAATLSSTGTPAVFLHPVEAFHGDLGLLGKGDVIVAVSHSGETDEVQALVEEAKRRKAKSVAIVGDPKSGLARTTDATITTGVEKEACPLGLAPTASSTAALAVGDALAMCVMEARGFAEKDFAEHHPGGSLGRRLSRPVRDFMIRGSKLPILADTGSLKKAAATMTKKGSIGVAILVKADGRLSGILTDGDLRRILASARNPTGDLAKAASRFMTRRPKTVVPETETSEAFQLMEKRSITSLVVLDPNSKPVGLIHLHDILGRGKLRV